MKPIILIPARLSATRFPNKPLAKINGLEMIIHVLKRAMATHIQDIYVACAEKEIAQCVIKHGGKAILTDPMHQSGSDRIYEALQKVDPDETFDVVINLQGDLPTFDPLLIDKLLYQLRYSNVDISTLVSKITEEEEKENPNVVKAILSVSDKKLHKVLYFTRACAPYGASDLFHHIGIYGYKRAALKKFVSLPPSSLEKIEKLEQLRALENNLSIYTSIVNTVPLGVDTAEDLKKAESLLQEEALYA